MELRDYFKETSGIGVLATADSEGTVDVAIYSGPFVLDNETLAFIMADRLSRKNLQSNPHAAYLFLESREGYEGKRLYLTMLKEGKGSEEENKELKEKYDFACEKYEGEALFLVYFRVDKVLPLVIEVKSS
ncbi:MAG: pyridoxamine 5'-phosphate oxidase family protein [Candidatus Aminicenantes bacterium]